MSRFRTRLNQFLNLLAAEVYYAVGPERKLTLFHISGILCALASTLLTISVALRIGGGTGLLWGIPLGLVIGFIAAGLSFWVGVGLAWLTLNVAVLLGCVHDTQPNPPPEDPER